MREIESYAGRVNKLSAASVFVFVGLLGLTGCSAMVGQGDAPSSAGSDSSSGDASSDDAADDADDTNDADDADADDADDVAGEPLTAAPATGAEVKGTGYVLHLPTGWSIGDPALAPGLDAVALRDGDDDGFNDNINVAISPTGLVPADQYETLAKRELQSVGAAEIEAEDRAIVDGASAAHISSLMTSQGVTYRTEQYMLSSDSQTFVVTFSFNQDSDDDARDALAESVMASWTFN